MKHFIFSLVLISGLCFSHVSYGMDEENGAQSCSSCEVISHGLGVTSMIGSLCALVKCIQLRSKFAPYNGPARAVNDGLEILLFNVLPGVLVLASSAFEIKNVVHSYMKRNKKKWGWCSGVSGHVFRGIVIAVSFLVVYCASTELDGFGSFKNALSALSFFGAIISFIGCTTAELVAIVQDCYYEAKKYKIVKKKAD